MWQIMVGSYNGRYVQPNASVFFNGKAVA